MSATRIRTHRCAAAFQAFGNTRSLHLTCLYRCRTDGDLLGRLEDHPATLPFALYGPSRRLAPPVAVATVLSARRTVAQGIEFVQVMNLPIKEIRNFESCRNLRQLHITDCRLERISGLEYNTELRELYLCA
eukprot:COSAG02_NODE_5514_length_4269_cov_1.743165_2_plen_132_part_00